VTRRGRFLAAGGWLAILALVVLTGRSLAYALAPQTPVATALEGATPGPRPMLVLLGLIAGVLVVAGGALALVVLAVQERSRLAGEPAPRLDLRRAARNFALLALAANVAFTVSESLLHMEEGLGFHGAHCLLGPVHRDAAPLLVALALLASALEAAARHLAAWLRRVVRVLRSPAPVPRGARQRVAFPFRPQPGSGRRLPGALGSRGPPRGRVDHRPHDHRRSTLMSHRKLARRACLALAGIAPLVAAQAASAHAIVSPPTVGAKETQVFTLAVPTEEEGATTTTITLTVPDGFSIDSFEAVPGWQRTVQSTGTGENTVVRSVTWSGGKVPTDEDSIFRFIGTATKSVSLPVRQTYSDGKVVEWTGAETSDTPAPQVKTVSSLGGGGSDTLSIVAIVLGGIAVVLSIVGLVGGKRSLA
jgi:uncharacterized protein YcnI